MALAALSDEVLSYLLEVGLGNDRHSLYLFAQTSRRHFELVVDLNTRMRCIPLNIKATPRLYLSGGGGTGLNMSLMGDLVVARKTLAYEAAAQGHVDVVLDHFVTHFPYCLDWDTIAGASVFAAKVGDWSLFDTLCQRLPEGTVVPWERTPHGSGRQHGPTYVICSSLIRSASLERASIFYDTFMAKYSGGTRVAYAIPAGASGDPDVIAWVKEAIAFWPHYGESRFEALVCRGLADGGHTALLKTRLDDSFLPQIVGHLVKSQAVDVVDYLIERIEDRWSDPLTFFKKVKPGVFASLAASARFANFFLRHFTASGPTRASYENYWKHAISHLWKGALEHGNLEVVDAVLERGFVAPKLSSLCLKAALQSGSESVLDAVLRIYGRQKLDSAAAVAKSGPLIVWGENPGWDNIIPWFLRRGIVYPWMLFYAQKPGHVHAILDANPEMAADTSPAIVDYFAMANPDHPFFWPPSQEKTAVHRTLLQCGFAHKQQVCVPRYCANGASCGD